METDKVFIIAEAGVNHNGSLDRALEMVKTAAEAGVDAIKFQTFAAEDLASSLAPMAEYQIKNTQNPESQLDMLRKLELKKEHHFLIKKTCEQLKIEFMSSPFSMQALQFLVEEVKLKRIKIPSGEITNAPFLYAVGRTGLPCILSTGMSDLNEVKTALFFLASGYSKKKMDQNHLNPSQQTLDQLSSELAQKVTLLHCTTEYPTPPEDVNLRAMTTLKSHFNLPTGYSDHTQGILASIAAVAAGAIAIEKHFTLDRNLPGPDHIASLNPTELRQLVSEIRQVERFMGSSEKKMATSEAKNKPIARKSLVASVAITKGDLFGSQNLTVKRPGSGLPPVNYWNLLNKKSKNTYLPDELILGNEIEGENTP